jgi:hypothetical protein
MYQVSSKQGTRHKVDGDMPAGKLGRDMWRGDVKPTAQCGASFTVVNFYQADEPKPRIAACSRCFSADPMADVLAFRALAIEAHNSFLAALTGDAAALERVRHIMETGQDRVSLLLTADERARCVAAGIDPDEIQSMRLARMAGEADGLAVQVQS